MKLGLDQLLLKSMVKEEEKVDPLVAEEVEVVDLFLVEKVIPARKRKIKIVEEENCRPNAVYVMKDMPLISVLNGRTKVHPSMNYISSHLIFVKNSDSAKFV